MNDVALTILPETNDDAPAIDELTARRERDEFRRVAMLCYAHGRGSLRSCFGHVCSPLLARP